MTSGRSSLPRRRPKRQGLSQRAGLGGVDSEGSMSAARHASAAPSFNSTGEGNEPSGSRRVPNIPRRDPQQQRQKEQSRIQDYSNLIPWTMRRRSDHDPYPGASIKPPIPS